MTPRVSNKPTAHPDQTAAPTTTRVDASVGRSIDPGTTTTLSIMTWCQGSCEAVSSSFM